ncbi:MAG: phosphotransferase [Gammaproteobacteria bacterium]
MKDNDFDLDALAAYLKATAPEIGAIRTIEKFAGGQSNPTYLLSADQGKYALRSKPRGKLLKSAHAVEREYRVMHALRDSDVPVPQTICLCEDTSIIGAVFFIMSYEAGRVFWDPSLPELSASERSDLYTDQIRVLAALHSADPTSLGLEDFGRPGNYFERQFNRWTEQYRASETTAIKPMESLIHWLGVNMPTDDGQSALIHGDYRLDNLIIRNASPTIQAVIDWELSTLGHPFADLAYLCMCLRMPNTGQIRGLGGIARAPLAIPQEADVVSTYCALRGIERIDHWPFYLAFSFFRLAAICQGVLKRAIDGNASSKRAREVGALAPELAKLGMGVIDSET